MKQVKELKLLIIICIISIILSGCSFKSIDINEIIKEPEVKKYILDGTWVLVENIEVSGKNIERKEIQMGERALFKNKNMYLSGKYSKNANYVLKNLDLQEFFASKYDGETLKKLLGTDRIKVIDIYDDDKFLMEIVKVGKGKFLLEEDDEFLIYERISKFSTVEEIDEYIEIDKEVFQKEKNENKKNENVGILLGIKSEIDDDLWEYETIYLKYHKGNLIKYRMDDILIPRKNGFYNIKVNRNSTGYDSLILNSDKADYKSKINRSKNKKNILHVGNDYISIETIGKDYDELGVYPLDYIDNNNRIKLSDILKEDDYNKLKFFTRNRKEKSVDEYNFSVVRKSGYWGLESRELIKEKSEYQWRDYELNINIPKSLINNNELSIPMWELKNKIPNIEDAFISPEENILIADTGYELRVYELLGDEYNEISRIKKNKSDIIIMSEWAVGDYTEEWEKEIIKYKK